jgi:hypothetical protein
MQTTPFFARLGLLICAVAPFSSPAAAEDAFVYEEQGIRFTVTHEGLSAIEVDGQRVAEGGWYAWDAGPGWFGRGEEGPAVVPHDYERLGAHFSEKTITRIADDHARVVHARPGVRATFDHRFEGEDVRISGRLENLDEHAVIMCPAMGGLRFDFGAAPRGFLPCWHHTYLHAAEGNVFHPNHNNQIGGAWGVGNGFAVGTSPQRIGMIETLTHWEFSDWRLQDNSPSRWLAFFRREPIPAGGAMRLDLLIRVSQNDDWEHLLQPYKDYFRAVYGPPRYDEWDARPMIMACINHSQQAVGPDNPYGFHGGHRRVDTPEGAAAFADVTTRILKAANGQGTLIWGLSGDHPRGAMYRPDFDCLPQEVEANWPTIVRRYEELGLKIGVCTRPRDIPWPLTYYQDGTVSLNPEDPQHLELLWKRFDDMMKKGCTLFYLDSFGSSFADVKIMRILREKMGPAIQTYAEHPCDAITPFTGFYTETDSVQVGNAGEERTEFRPRTSLQLLEVCRWLLDSPVPTVTRGGPMPWRFEHQITPLLPDYGDLESFKQVEELTRQHLDERGRWKK